jgi:hypothetical protein
VSNKLSTANGGAYEGGEGDVGELQRTKPIGKGSKVAEEQMSKRDESFKCDADELVDSLRASVSNPQQRANVVDRILRELVRPYHESMSWGDRLLTLDKSAAFRDDATFRAAWREADSSTGKSI